MSEFNPFAMAQAQLDATMEILGLDDSTRSFLRQPMFEARFTIPVRLDSGKMQTFEGYRVQYNTARGPGKGGLRWHPEETLDTVRALSAWMTWKTSLLNLPLGGAKGGVTCDPKNLTTSEKERLARGYIRKVALLLDQTKDVPAPDVYTNPQIMAWMMDEYETLRGHHHPGVITGKPIALGGSQGRTDATARGGIYTVREAAKHLHMDPSQSTYAIQGMGNAGQYAALLHQRVLGGGKLVAVSDSRGAVYNPQGIDPESVVNFKLEHGTLEGFDGCERITNEDLLSLDVDILYPAALENAITEKNAPNIKAKLICELANGPVSPEADKILTEKNVFVIPDFLANAGGVTVSYFESVQNASNYYWTLQDVHRHLDEKMTTAFNAAYESSRKHKLNMRMGAYLLAVERVAEACRLRGWV